MLCSIFLTVMILEHNGANIEVYARESIVSNDVRGRDTESVITFI